jgi:hypothetical protein
MEDFAKGFQERYCLYPLFRNEAKIADIIFHRKARIIPTRWRDVTTKNYFNFILRKFEILRRKQFGDKYREAVFIWAARQCSVE